MNEWKWNEKMKRFTISSEQERKLFFVIMVQERSCGNKIKNSSTKGDSGEKFDYEM
jgi:hypothetical protein